MGVATAKLQKTKKEGRKSWDLPSFSHAFQRLLFFFFYRYRRYKKGLLRLLLGEAGSWKGACPQIFKWTASGKWDIRRVEMRTGKKGRGYLFGERGHLKSCKKSGQGRRRKRAPWYLVTKTGDTQENLILFFALFLSEGSIYFHLSFFVSSSLMRLPGKFFLFKFLLLPIPGARISPLHFVNPFSWSCTNRRFLGVPSAPITLCTERQSKNRGYLYIEMFYRIIIIFYGIITLSSLRTHCLTPE